MQTTRSDGLTVSVVIVNWNGGESVLDCLASLREQSRLPDEIVVVDNASHDGSPDEIVRRFPHVQVIRNASNVGYGAGVNRGVAAACGEWIALLNNDAIADHEWIARMLAVAAANPAYGMVACKIYLDRAQRILDKVGHRIAIDGQNFGRGHGSIDDGRYDGLTEVAWPDGCAGLWRRAVLLQVGGLDEQFFAYADDADRTDTGLWSNVAPADRKAVLGAILRAQLDGWLGVLQQLRKRRAIRARCGAGWQQRFRSLLREDRVPLADVARANVR